MINWNNPTTTLPIPDTDDAFNYMHGISKRLIVYYRVMVGDIKVDGITFGKYKTEERWLLEEVSGVFTILGWSYVNKPEF
jgi:hypothetical protein